jgi:hypothetical protein
LRDAVPWERASDRVEEDVTAAVESADGPSLSAYMAAQGTLDEFREFAVHRSAYQLKEADPHTWAIPRMAGEAKAALVAIQMDEYGCGRARDVHATLFEATLESLGLDASYGAYLPRLPGTTLATTNLVTMFGLHRRWRGALIGHLTVFEMTSVGPMGRYAAALTRLGLPRRARQFYDVHVVADAEHEVVARNRMAAGLGRDEPSLRDSILFGANAVLAIEGGFAAHMLQSWAAGRSSLVASSAGAALPRSALVSTTSAAAA